MATKRKDNKGRVLRKGESQRKDLIYQYRFVDTDGTRRAVYASSLNELRQKESEIDTMLRKNIVFYSSQITVLELVEKHLSLKANLRASSSRLTRAIVNGLSRDSFSQRKIKDIKTSDIKAWYLTLNKNGKKRGTIHNLHSLLRASFQMAYEEDVIEKNPFNFSIKFIPDDAKKRIALTLPQQQSLFSYMKTDSIARKYYDMYYILLWTGLRVSELCGLTISDLDFDNRLINVNHQLIYDHHGGFYISPPKSQSGFRMIPMTDEVFDSFQRILSKRKVKTEKLIDGKTGFIFMTLSGNPRNATNVDMLTRRLMDRYNQTHPGSQIFHVTPHVFRHTFCTNMANAGMNIKDLQYLMGHATIDMTMNLYSHTSTEHAVNEMINLIRRLKQDELDEFSSGS